MILAVIKLNILKLGLDLPKILDTVYVEDLIKVALPHQAENIAKYGTDAYHYLLDELESCLLEELRKMLEGGESDKASVEKAAAILKESERLMEKISQSQSALS